MISILDSSYKRLAIIKSVKSDNISKEINGEYTFVFECILDAKTSLYVVEGNLVEVEEDYFDIVYYQKQQNDDGTLTIQVQCEHISYRLNDEDYDLDTFASTGTVSEVLGDILSGTGFSIGTVEISDNVTYSAQEKKSRRQILMEFIDYIDTEVDFNKLSISVRTHIGSTSRKLLVKGKNVKVVSKIYNSREKNELGQALVSYTVTPIQLPNLVLDIGDEVLLIQKELGIQEQLRIVKISYSTYNNIEASIELANFVSNLEDQFYRIETQQITKEKIYNGCKIGPENGFEAIRSDEKAKTVMNATEGISIYSDIGDGLEKNFFVDTNGRIQGKSLDIDGDSIFHGKVDVTNGNIDVLIAPDGTTAFKINYDTTEIFKVDTSGNATLKQVTLRNDLTGSNYLSISPSGLFAWDNSLSLKTFEIDSSGKAYFRGDITSDATITGATIRSGAVNTDRIELSSGKFRGLNSSNQITGLYFDIGAIAGTGIADLFLYHNNTKLVEFYDDITAYAIRGSAASTGLTLGGASATTYAKGVWDFGGSTIYDLVTNGNGIHDHGASTGSAGSHNHGIANGTVLLTDSGSVVWVEASGHSHSIDGDGLHDHVVQSS